MQLPPAVNDVLLMIGTLDTRALLVLAAVVMSTGLLLSMCFRSSGPRSIVLCGPAKGGKTRLLYYLRDHCASPTHTSQSVTKAHCQREARGKMRTFAVTDIPSTRPTDENTGIVRSASHCLFMMPGGEPSEAQVSMLLHYLLQRAGAPTTVIVNTSHGDYDKEALAQ
ncbi:hypothetical protein KIPB_011591, partial [Kipferlia bialata]|eukprot:g11591.t1